jgi:hypothetical protein
MYKHAIYNIGEVCYAYEFCKCGDFRYRFYQSMGNGTIQGNWIKNGDTIIFNTNDAINNLSTCNKLNHKPEIHGKRYGFSPFQPLMTLPFTMDKLMSIIWVCATPI